MKKCYLLKIFLINIILIMMIIIKYFFIFMDFIGDKRLITFDHFINSYNKNQIASILKPYLGINIFKINNKYIYNI